MGHLPLVDARSSALAWWGLLANVSGHLLVSVDNGAGQQPKGSRRLAGVLLRRHSAASCNGVCLAAGPLGHRRVVTAYCGFEGEATNVR